MLDAFGLQFTSLVLCPKPPALQRIVVALELFFDAASLESKSLPDLYAHRIECVARPLHDMERIHAAHCLGHVLLNAIVDPASAVAADASNVCPQLFGQALKELLEHALAVVLMHPDHLAGVVVDDNGHVFVALTVGSLVDAYIDESLKTPLVRIGIKVKLSPLDAAADRFPVDAHELSMLDRGRYLASRAT